MHNVLIRRDLLLHILGSPGIVCCLISPRAWLGTLHSCALLALFLGLPPVVSKKAYNAKCHIFTQSCPQN